MEDATEIIVKVTRIYSFLDSSPTPEEEVASWLETLFSATFWSFFFIVISNKYLGVQRSAKNKYNTVKSELNLHRDQINSDEQAHPTNITIYSHDIPINYPQEKRPNRKNAFIVQLL